MNRRDLLKLIPGLSLLPFVRKLVARESGHWRTVEIDCQEENCVSTELFERIIRDIPDLCPLCDRPMRSLGWDPDLCYHFSVVMAESCGLPSEEDRPYYLDRTFLKDYRAQLLRKLEMERTVEIGARHARGGIAPGTAWFREEGRRMNAARSKIIDIDAMLRRVEEAMK